MDKCDESINVAIRQCKNVKFMDLNFLVEI